jgi:hypothetical protein
MEPSATPRPEEWRESSFDREEDAAYTFGSHLTQHCRSEALKGLESAGIPKTEEAFRAEVTKAVDTALHSVMDLLEGFWPTQAGPNHRVAYALSVCVSAMDRKTVERIDISPCAARPAHRLLEVEGWGISLKAHAIFCIQ